MADTFVYIVPLPPGVNEMVTPCLDGFTIYINETLSPEQRDKAYHHALDHIRKNDFQKSDVQEIEHEQL